MIGICTSISTASKAVGRVLRISRANWPSAARVARASSYASARSTRSRLIALSSTTNRFRPARRDPHGGESPLATGRAPETATVGPAGARARTSRNQKVLPWPDWLSTPISPPISSTSRLQMDRPSPVPPKRRVIPASAWVKGANSRGRTAGAMPMPVSRTVKRNHTASSPVSITWTCRVTSPRSVNLMALPTRLISTCCNRSTSPTSGPSDRGGSETRSRTPLACAEDPIRLSTSANRVPRSKGCGSMRSWPASILERSRRSLMITSRDLPAVQIRSTRSRWFSPSGSRPNSWVRPSTAFSGVRIS